jgi:uncharacterized membrane protein
MSALAAVSIDARHNDRDLDDTPFASICSPNVSTLLSLAAAGEMVVDKLPILPNRTDLLPLLGRVFFAGVSGAAVFIEEKQPAPVGAAVAALASVASTNVSFQLRRGLSRRLPGLLAALVGDAAVVALGYTFTRT